jgi:multidrug efflux pump subunit AcrA (membrane-fusion protein)
MEIDRIEDWMGQTVVDPDGEKVGKLNDVFFGAGSRDAVAAAIKTGLLGRKVAVVSLTGASVARDHVKIAFSKDTVKKAPQVESGLDLSEVERGELQRHYDMELPPGTVESGNARAERERRAAETAARAAELEKEAEKKTAEARDKERAAEAAQKERDEAQREAEEARRAASGPSDGVS